MTDGKRTYGVALLSAAMHQRNFARAFADHPRLRLIRLVDEPNQEPYVERSNQALAAQYGIPYVQTLDALDDPEIDVVSVDAQLERRARVATGTARRGKHLWIDKPPARTAADCAPLVQAVAAAGLQSLVFCHVAADWCVALRHAIAGGRIGDLQALHLDFQFIKGDALGIERRAVPAGTDSREVWTFRDADAATDPTGSGHNVIAKRELAEEGWYSLALARHLCPQPIRRVFATTGAYFLPGHVAAGVEDFATLSLTLEDGPLITISTGRTGRLTHAGTGRMAVRAAGSRGTIVMDGAQPPALTFRGVQSPAGLRSTPARESTGIDNIVARFVAQLDGEAAPVFPIGAAHHLMTLLDAAYRSASLGQPVDVVIPRHEEA